MKWYHYVICGVLILIGIFSAVEIINILDVKSKEYGTAITLVTKNNYNEVSVFDYGSINLETTNYSSYSNVKNFAHQDFDGNKGEYTLLFNDHPLNNVVVKSGKISGTLTLDFYNIDGSVVSTAKANFIVEYFADATVVTVTTVNENNSVSYLTAYMEINGAVLKVVSKEASVWIV